MFVDVILPLSLANTYTYQVPVELQSKIAKGMRVLVPVQKKLYTGIVLSVTNESPQGFEVKMIEEILDTQPMVRSLQLQFWLWIADYYQAFLGDVYKVAVPSAMKLESESQVVIYSKEEFLSDEQLVLTTKEQRLFVYLEEGKVKTIREIEKESGIKNVLPAVKSMIDKGILSVSEKIQQNYRPKKEVFCKLSPAITTEEHAEQALYSLRNAEKQRLLFSAFLRLTKSFSAEAKMELSRKTLFEEFDSNSYMILKALIKKGFLITEERVVSRLEEFDSSKMVSKSVLNEVQQQAFKEIHTVFEQKKCCLLHGVTSSGKTEIYIHLIEETLQRGRQALLLLPEIALTTQLAIRLKKVFGNRLGVYHSKYSDAERVEVWDNLLNNKGYDVILGVRSSLFLPFQDLGLIIVDEEHEQSYKQMDPAPRYHARDAALVLAMMHDANILLGTATPSIESYNNSLNGRYGLVNLTHRYNDVKLPQIKIVDTKELRRKKQMKGIFSPELISSIQRVVEDGEQVILFQNRRGYAPLVECEDCGYVPRCKNCDVTLTVHKFSNALTCHYCGYTESLKNTCPQCGSERFDSKGFGTEKVEEELKLIFPQMRVGRMDWDTTRTRTSYERIISSFENGEIDILIGTQMLTKGLDFSRVSLVGVLNADTMLNYPDFRAHERAFQLLCQVSGRSGRKQKQGLVLIQTNSPDHSVLQQVVTNDYFAMYNQQMKERKEFSYPPFVRLINVILKHRDEEILKKASSELAYYLRQSFGERVLGPNEPTVARVQNMYLKRITLKIEQNASVQEAKSIIRYAKDYLLSLGLYRSLQIYLDVDPI